jgi:hypothetical protein
MKTSFAFLLLLITDLPAITHIGCSGNPFLVGACNEKEDYCKNSWILRIGDGGLWLLTAKQQCT